MKGIGIRRFQWIINSKKQKRLNIFMILTLCYDCVLSLTSQNGVLKNIEILYQATCYVLSKVR